MSAKNRFKVICKKFSVFFFLPIILIVLDGIISFFINFNNHSKWICLIFLVPIVIHIFGWFLINNELENLIHSNNSATGNSEKIPLHESIDFIHTASVDVIHRMSVEVIQMKSDDGSQIWSEGKLQSGAEKYCFFYNWTILFAVIFYGLGWMGYIFNASLTLVTLKWFSYLCLVFILLLFLVALFVTYIIMENSQRHKLSFIIALKDGLELFPFWRFAHFFAIFMSISFLFGFAFAFHDLSYRKTPESDSAQPNTSQDVSQIKPALYVENLASDEDKNKEEKTPAKEPAKSTRDMSLGCFYFESGKAKFIAEDRTDELAEADSTDIKKRIGYQRDDTNNKQSSKLLTQIKNNSSQGILRITLIGRADDKKSGNIYPSNYALSEARINVIRYVITTNLYSSNDRTWQSIDWVTVPYSNEDSKLIKGNCMDLKKDVDSGRRVVEVYLNMVSPDAETLETNILQKMQMEALKNKYKTPNLMDYMYFSIYTISTTGYGDIKPATNYAKFLVSLENFFEVFFLVCFMNTLIALKSKTITLKREP